jgi:hypothetical protein
MPPVRLLLFAFAAAVSGIAAASADQSPAAGRPERPAAIEGKLGEPLSNGAVRFTLLEVRDARPGDHPEYVVPLASEKVMVVTARVHNVAPKAFAGLLTYTLDAAGDASFLVPGHFLTPATLDLQPGAKAKQSALFPVDKGLVPTVLRLGCASCGKNFTPFRIAIPAAAP